jgi:hypothetical protein
MGLLPITSNYRKSEIGWSQRCHKVLEPKSCSIDGRPATAREASAALTKHLLSPEELALGHTVEFFIPSPMR